MTKKKKKKKTLYDTLNLNPNCNKEDVRRAYKKKVKEVHPDKGGDPEEFKEVNRAYVILYDSESRYKYDSTGEEEKPSERKKVDIDKQAETFLIKTLFDIIDRHGENFSNINVQRALLEMFNSVRKEIETRLNSNKITWKAVRNKYRAVKKKKSTIESGSILDQILQQKLNNIVNQEIMKIKIDHKRLITDRKIFNKVIEMVTKGCVDTLIEKDLEDPLRTWDRNMAWGTNNPYMSSFNSNQEK